MKKLTLVSLLILSLCLMAASTFAAPVSLKFASTNAAGEQAFEVQKEWTDAVEKASNGRIKISLLPLDAVVKSSDLLTGVRNNIIDGAVSTSAHYAGDDAGFGLIGDTISAWNSDEDILKFYYYGGGLEVVDKIFQAYGAKLIGVCITGAESLPSKLPLRGVEDFKGVKMRAPSGPIHKLFAKMGAAPVGLPGSEIYTSLERALSTQPIFHFLQQPEARCAFNRQVSDLPGDSLFTNRSYHHEPEKVEQPAGKR